MKKLLCSAMPLLAGIVALGAFAQGANAATITYSQDITDFNYTTNPLPAPLSVTNPAPSSVTGQVYAPGAMGTVTGSVANLYRSPFENISFGTSLNGPPYNIGNSGYGITGWDSLPYSSVQGGGSATYSTIPGSNPAGANTLSILWGSPDSYNTLAFYNASDLLGTITGSPNGTYETGILSGIALEIQTYGHDQMTFTDNGGLFTSVVLSSTTNAFEFADLSSSYVELSRTPLPSTWTMLIAGFIGLGFFAYRGTTKASAAAV